MDRQDKDSRQLFELDETPPASNRNQRRSKPMAPNKRLSVMIVGVLFMAMLFLALSQFGGKKDEPVQPVTDAQGPETVQPAPQTLVMTPEQPSVQGSVQGAPQMPSALPSGGAAPDVTAALPQGGAQEAQTPGWGGAAPASGGPATEGLAPSVPGTPAEQTALHGGAGGALQPQTGGESAGVTPEPATQPFVPVTEAEPTPAAPQAALQPAPAAPKPAPAVQQPKAAPAPSRPAAAKQSAGPKNQLKNIKVQVDHDAVRLVISTQNPLQQFKHFSLTEPQRMVVDLVGDFKPHAKSMNVPPNNYVSALRIGDHPDKLRIVADIKAGAALKMQVQRNSPEEIVVIITR